MAGAGRHHEALEASEKAGQLFMQIGNEKDILLSQLSKGSALFKLGRGDEAFPYLDKLVQNESLPFTLRSYALLYLTLAEIYLNRNDFSKADQALDVIDQHLADSDLFEYKIEFHRIKALVKNRLGQPQAAFNFLQTHNLLSEQLAREESQMLRQEMETKYLTKEKDLQISLQYLQLSRAKQQKLLFVLGLMTLTAIASLLFLLSRNRQKANRTLAQEK